MYSLNGNLSFLLRSLKLHTFQRHLKSALIIVEHPAPAPNTSSNKSQHAICLSYFSYCICVFAFSDCIRTPRLPLYVLPPSFHLNNALMYFVLQNIGCVLWITRLYITPLFPACILRKIHLFFLFSTRQPFLICAGILPLIPGTLNQHRNLALYQKFSKCKLYGFLFYYNRSK